MTSKICSICAPECRTCEKETICLSCSNSSKVLSLTSCEDQCLSNYFEDNGVCKLCSYPCLTCTNSSDLCLSCAEPYILFENICISQCGLNYFQNDSRCLPCVYPCKRCSSIDICLSCELNPEFNNQTYLWNNSCI